MWVNSLVQGALSTFISHLYTHVLPLHLREIETTRELDSLRSDLAFVNASLTSMTSERQRLMGEVEQLRSARD